MKRFYSLLVAALFICLSAQAYTDPTVDLTDSTCWHFDNYRLAKNFDFINWQLNGEALPEWALNADPASFTVYNDVTDSYVNVYQVSSKGLSFMYAQDTNIYHRTNRVTGIFVGASNRILTMKGMKKDQVIMIQAGTTTTNTYEDNAHLSYPEGEAVAIDITDSIHALQEEIMVEVDDSASVPGTADAFHYYMMTADGDFNLVLANGNYISVLLIYNNTLNPEFVDAPSFEVKAVNYEDRMLAINPGESSYSNPVLTYWSIGDEDPIFRDEETGLPTTINGEWGDNFYDPDLDSDGWVEVYESDDEDGDGFVQLNAASITADGIVSDVASLNVPVGLITLNAPTLTLTAIDGIDRTYKIDWKNNTLCKEDYELDITIDDDYYEGDYVVGDEIMAHDAIEVRVVCDGYDDGVYTLDELDMEGIEVRRANEEKAAEGKHDYTYLSDELDEELLEKIENLYVSGAYYVNPENPADTTWYSRERYLAGEDDVPTEAVEYIGYYDWTYDAARTRAWLDVETDDPDSLVWRYKGDAAGALQGLIIKQDITASSTGEYSSGLALYTSNIGLYFMRKSTVTVPNVQYGQFVIVHHGKGGSNYVDTEYNTCEMVGTAWNDETQQMEGNYSFDKNGDYIQWIDVYTYDDLPQPILSGDVDNNGAVNVADIASIASYILGDEPDPFNLDAADFNADGSVNVTDISLVANSILTGGESASKAKTILAAAEGSATLTLSADEVVAGQEFTLNVDLNNPDDAICGVQADIYLPEGLEFVLDEYDEPTVEGGRSSKITTECALQGNGALRILCYSAKNYTYTGTEGAVATIAVKAADTFTTGDIAMKKIVLSSYNNKKVAQIKPADFTLPVGGADAINGINAETANAAMFNLAGQSVDNSFRGVVIMNGKKVLVK